ncbi:M10 family metallopeptidase C-terminal domain-containing protein, partial [Tateyamaria omphalii]|uniref:M10 family metallopeptidase C-terminal domain-containing protein n=1 Tax=Tateyamaria omphalii TaxID=299262 RepID=UPI001E58256A
MCTVCFATQTFDPMRHGNGPDPLLQNIFEDVNAPDGISTTNSMAVGDSFLGTINGSGDEDWVSITLTAGESYDISLAGTGTATENPDPYLYIYDANGTLVTSNDDSGGTRDSFINFNVTTGGTYYLVADAWNTNFGDYRLSVTEAYTYPPSGIEGTLDELAGYLTNGYWGGQQYTFDTSSSNVITVNLSGLTAAGQQLARWAMEAWEMVANLDFQEVAFGSEMITFDDNESGAFAYRPNGGSSSGVELNVGTGWLNSYGTSIDSYSFQTYVHEIGHAIGLGHQGGYNGSASYPNDTYFTNDSWQMSVMSYFNQNENTTVDAGYAFTAGPMMADIVAIQNLYGAPGASTATAGDTTYGVNSSLGNYMDQLFTWLSTGQTSANVTGSAMVFTIYDVSGTDTFDGTYTDAPVRLDLRAEQFSDIGAANDVLAIARGTVIENAILGGGNDTVTGNSANNVLSLGIGNDSAEGGAGDDSIDGGIGFDTIRGGADNDTILGGDGADSLFGDDGNDLIIGDVGFDQLFGGAGNDTLSSGATADRVFGGDGNDVIRGGSNVGITVDGLFGEAGDDTIFGDGGFDLLDGGDGNDSLDGGNQADNLFGRGGEDTLIGGQGFDRLFGGAENDVLIGGQGTDGLFGQQGNDDLNGGT